MTAWLMQMNLTDMQMYSKNKKNSKKEIILPWFLFNSVHPWSHHTTIWRKFISFTQHVDRVYIKQKSSIELSNILNKQRLFNWKQNKKSFLNAFQFVRWYFYLWISFDTRVERMTGTACTAQYSFLSLALFNFHFFTICFIILISKQNPFD